jgi:hypothetical protein
MRVDRLLRLSAEHGESPTTDVGRRSS